MKSMMTIRSLAIAIAIAIPALLVGQPAHASYNTSGDWVAAGPAGQSLTKSVFVGLNNCANTMVGAVDVGDVDAGIVKLPRVLTVSTSARFSVTATWRAGNKDLYASAHKSNCDQIKTWAESPVNTTWTISLPANTKYVILTSGLAAQMSWTFTCANC